MNKNSLYFDYAAATPLDSEVSAAIHRAEHIFANPSAQYKPGREARDRLEQARREVALALGCTAAEIIFTSGGTESDNLALFGLANLVEQTTKKPAQIITIATEHKAVLEPIARLSDQGWSVELCPIDQYGVVDLGSLQKLIRDDTAIITIALASSEIGTIQPLAQIGQLVAKVRTARLQSGSKVPLYLHSDGSAAIETLPVNVNRLGVDSLSINAAKIYGPKGSGTLFVRRRINIAAQIVGGGQESGRRSGTENLAGAVGLSAALQKTVKLRTAESKRLASLRDELLNDLSKLYPQLELNGHSKLRLAGNLNISLPGINGETLVSYLDAAGVAVATGAACAASNSEPSVAILALGKSAQTAQSSLRISLGRQTTRQQISEFAQILTTTTKKLATIEQ